MVLNKDVKLINQVLLFCIYESGYYERYPMVAISKVTLMLHLQSITSYMFRAFPENLK